MTASNLTASNVAEPNEAEPNEAEPNEVGQTISRKQLNLDDLLTRSYPLEEINEAYDALIKGEVARSIISYD